MGKRTLCVPGVVRSAPLANPSAAAAPRCRSTVRHSQSAPSHRAAFSGPVFRVFAPPSPTSPAPSPLAARGYGPAYLRASPSKLRGPSRPSAFLITARCSGAADALWACPRASSRSAAFDCALRFAPCARHFSPSGLRCSQAHSRLSSVPTIRNSRLAALPLATLLCSLDFRFACFRHWRRRSSVPLALSHGFFDSLIFLPGG